MADIRMNEASNKEVKNMTYRIWNNGDYNISQSAFKALAIVRCNMTDEQFLVEWASMYPQHCYGGYQNEQLYIWKTNPFEFVHKWPKFAHHLVKSYN